jgi:hypothetical protein
MAFKGLPNDGKLPAKTIKVTTTLFKQRPFEALKEILYN